MHCARFLRCYLLSTCYVPGAALFLHTSCNLIFRPLDDDVRSWIPILATVSEWGCHTPHARQERPSLPVRGTHCPLSLFMGPTFSITHTYYFAPQEHTHTFARGCARACVCIRTSKSTTSRRTRHRPVPKMENRRARWSLYLILKDHTLHNSKLLAKP